MNVRLHPGVRRAAFWVAVALVAQLSNVAVEIAADKWPNAGFVRFVAYAHKGKGN